MIEQIEVRTKFGKSLVVPLRGGAHGLFIKSLDGLDPTKSSIVTTSFARKDGTQKQASRREARFPKIVFGFDPYLDGDTVESIRNQLFRVFMTKSEVELFYTTSEGLQVRIEGEVESFDAPRMTEEPDATIGVHCFDPDFRAMSAKVVDLTTTADESFWLLDYAGTTETGMVMEVKPQRPMSNVVLDIIPENGVAQTLEFQGGLLTNDILEISTVTFQKGAWLRRAGTRKSVLQGVSAFSDWVNLFPGENRIRVRSEGSDQPVSITYLERYGAI